MYVITFYSYKGGVGRSMALVNAAIELAQRGRKVLIVDFDLEAPGILDFDIAKPPTPHKGMIDFVTDYVNTDAVPDVDDYIFSSNQFRGDGSLHIMPAGKLDQEYQARFANINWSDLYQNKNGYLLMEDLRLQWEEKFNFDYVLIDSRTGYTDIAGICTRQLPDAVCLVFSPNRQNIAGLQKIRADIETQKEISGLRHPAIHFVASNIPNLGDDNSKLESYLANFQKDLGYDQLSGSIHHYPSFALLENEIFTLKFPHAALSNEYRELVGNIVKNNLRDRLGVIEYLGQLSAQLAQSSLNAVSSEVDDKVNNILANFRTDPEVILACARVKRLAGDVEQHRELLEVAIEQGAKMPRAFLELAVYQERENNGEEAWANVRKALVVGERLSSADLILAIRLGLRQFNDNLDLSLYLNSVAVQNMSNDELVYVCTSVNDSITCSRLIVLFFTQIFDWTNPSSSSVDAKILLGNAYVSLGQLVLAKEVYAPKQRIFDEQDIVYKFNYSMIKFWSNGETDRLEAISQFEHILKKYDPHSEGSPNTDQCFAFMYWAVGRQAEAISKLETLGPVISGASPVRFFSCWRYHYVSRRQATEDIAEMLRLFSGSDLKPRFLRLDQPIT